MENTTVDCERKEQRFYDDPPLDFAINLGKDILSFAID